MSQKLSDAEVQAIIETIWSMTVDDRGVALKAETPQGQMALDIVAKIVAAALVLRIKPDSEVIPFPRPNS